jgi:hypothetical protein
MSDDLVERVARAIFDARHQDLRDCWSWDDYWGDDQEPDRKFYYRDARVAIAIALEEAARVADAKAADERASIEPDGDMEDNAAFSRGAFVMRNLAAAIRAMITPGSGS